MRAIAAFGLVVLVALAAHEAAAETTWTVDPGGGGDFTTIQACIDAALEGDTCLVNPGTYPENVDFMGKDIVLRSSGGAAVTIIDGQGQGSAVVFLSGESAGAVLDGFTLTGGIGTYHCVYPVCWRAGGGVYGVGASPTVTNCTIRGNTATSGGGVGFYGGGDSSPALSGCTVQANTAAGGGGIYAEVGALALTNCFIRGNTALGEGAAGGGVYSASDSLSITNSTITGNTALGLGYSAGGGVSNQGNGLRIVNSILWGNAATDGPQILHTPSLEPAYATVKYDPDGNALWAARYDGPADRVNRAQYACVDASGNVYVTGSSAGEGTGSDYATVKYDPEGNPLWVARYNGPASGGDSAQCVAVDAQGNVFVTGLSYEPGHPYSVGYATVKYDSDGNELWVARSDYGGPNGYFEYPTASGLVLAVDQAGNVYVTGTSFGFGTNDDYATAKYDPEGNELWVARYNGPVNSADNVASLALGAAGSVYVTGRSEGGWGESGTKYDYATVKYDAAGNELWTARYNGPASGLDVAYALAVDAYGNVLVAGRSEAAGTGYDFTTVKYDSEGNQLWEARYDGPVAGVDMAFSISLDASGNAYVAGPSRVNGTDYDYATVKYDPDGSQLWAARFASAGGDDIADSVVVDAAGNVYVTGAGSAADDSTDYATVKYDPYGNELWVARYDGPDSDDDGAVALAVDASGYVHVAGSSNRFPVTRVARYSNVQGGWLGEGNIDQEPLFTLPGTYRLTASSPCIDAGLGSAPGLPSTDLDGNPRIVDGNGDGAARVDMGAHEFQPAPAWTQPMSMIRCSGFRSEEDLRISNVFNLLAALWLPLAAGLCLRIPGRKGRRLLSAPQQGRPD